MFVVHFFPLRFFVWFSLVLLVKTSEGFLPDEFTPTIILSAASERQGKDSSSQPRHPKMCL